MGSAAGPAEEGVLEAGEGLGEGAEEVEGKALGVLEAWGEIRIVREGEDERDDGGGVGEEGFEEGAVLGSDGDGDGEAGAGGEEVDEVQEGEHVALGRERYHQNVGSDGLGHLSRLVLPSK